MRPMYRQRRDALHASLARHLPEVRPAGSAAGLHLLAWLPDGVDEAGVIARAAEAGVGVYGLDAYWHDPARRRGGLIFGYAGLPESAIREGVALLAGVLRA
jgi:GntR family transcriptional regulator/MocR family aminotransferase